MTFKTSSVVDARSSLTLVFVGDVFFYSFSFEFCYTITLARTLLCVLHMRLTSY